MKIDGEAFLGALEMYGRRVYFAYPELRIRPGDIVLDLGANQGLFTLLASRIGGRCVAVEMQSGMLTLIRRNLAANGCRAEIVHGLIGSSTGVCSDRARMRAASHFGSEPRVVTLNGLVEEFGLPRIDFLKIDIEGSEFDVFGHNTEWLEITRQIAMEVHGPHGDPEEIADVLYSAGFQVRRRTASTQRDRCVARVGIPLCVSAVNPGITGNENSTATKQLRHAAGGLTEKAGWKPQRSRCDSVRLSESSAYVYARQEFRKQRPTKEDLAGESTRYANAGGKYPLGSMRRRESSGSEAIVQAAVGLSIVAAPRP